MSDDPIKAAEQRGYARGYQAGRRRLDVDIDRERVASEREAFRREAFLAALPSCIIAQGWTRRVNGEEVKITSLVERTKLAWDFADQAVKGTWF